MRRVKGAPIAVGLLISLVGAVSASESASADFETRQSRDDAWWTGPLLAASASTLPQGHFLFEPYLYDAIVYGHYDKNGTRGSAPRTNNYRSQSYVLYGLVDKVTVGLIPRFGFTNVDRGNDSSKIGVGDLGLQAQYRFTQFTEESRLPTLSFVFQETLPTGKYDRLGDHPSDGLGAGAYITTVSLYSQYYFWMPNGRILRTRLNVSRSFADNVNVHDESAYGTPEGFRGTARPGGELVLNSSWEYSVTRNWVLALDFIYQHDNTTRVSGHAADFADSDFQGLPIRFESGSSRQFGVAPAIEYNWSGSVGVIAGARWIADGCNAGASITPAVAINLVY